MGTCTNNGKRLLNMCSSFGLKIGGSIFPHKKIHKGTWHSPDGQTLNQIDHICISHRWATSLRDTRVYRSVDIGSDHYLIVANVKVKLKSRCITKKTASPYDTRKLLNAQFFLRAITSNYQIGSQHYKIQTTRKTPVSTFRKPSQEQLRLF